jgi:tRNA(Ile)-lysidine synthase
VSRPARLPGGFRDALVARGDLGPGDGVMVALSGGLDSVVLLHLLRFASASAKVRVHAAHFDHGMRPSSVDDAHWVAGLCRAWGVELHAARAHVVPASEAEAREARYAYLERVRAEAGARCVVTAHHADDQAETVLFRVLRGTGQGGLAGIPARREPALWRPLLDFWREELRAYAERARLSWREDPTNADLGYARNALRLRILPDVERLVASGARKSLVRLARIAGEDEAGWESVLPILMEPLGVSIDAGGVSLDAAALRALHPAVQARILRALAAEAGTRLDEGATRRAVDFASAVGSGRRVDLGGAWSLQRDLDRLVLRAERAVPPDVPLRIRDARPGAGEALIAGERVRVVWGGDEAAFAETPCRHAESFDTASLRFPLTVRAREPGDRIRLHGGTKKVKSLFLEMRLPPSRRERTPLVVDADGRVLWIPAMARGELPSGRASLDALRIGIE